MSRGAFVVSLVILLAGAAGALLVSCGGTGGGGDKSDVVDSGSLDSTNDDTGPGRDVDARADLDSASLEDAATDDGTATGDGTEEPEMVGLLTVANQGVLEDARQRFLQDLPQGEPEARAKVVQWLNTDAPGVDSAGVFRDGNTVGVLFDDGSWGGLVATDPAKPSLGAGPSAPATVLPLPTSVAPPFLSTPESTNVLLLNIVGSEFPEIETQFQAVRARFLAKGWNDGEITVLTRKDDDDLSIHLGTWSQFGDYGIIFIVAHGLYGKLTDIKTETDAIDADVLSGWVQCCSAGNYKPIVGDAEVAQWMAWSKQGRLFQMLSTSGRTSIYVRSDLLRDRMQHVPNSFIYMMTCWGWFSRHIFMDNGAGAFLGWTHKVMVVDAVEALRNIADNMLAVPAVRAVDLGSAGVRDTSPNDLGATAELNLDPENSGLHFPSWLEVSVSSGALVTLPDNEHVELSVDYADSLAQDVTAYQAGGPALPVSCVMPVLPLDATVSGRSMNPVSTVSGVDQKTLTLGPGRNSISLELSTDINVSLYLMGPWIDEGDGATRWNWILQWSEIPGAVDYHITGQSNGYPVGSKTELDEYFNGIIWAEGEVWAPYRAGNEAGLRYYFFGGSTVYGPTPGYVEGKIDEQEAAYKHWTFEVSPIFP